MNVYTPDGSKIVHYTYADMSNRQITRPVHLVQYDDALPVIAVKLYNDGQKYTIPDDATVNIRCGKADGKMIYNPALGCDSSRHIVYFEVTKQMTAFAGDMVPVVEIESSNGSACSGAIALSIDYNPVQNDNIRSTNEYLTAKQYAEQAIDAAAKASSSASQASGYANTASAKASSASSSASSAAGSANAAGASASDAKRYAELASLSKDAAATSKQKAEASEVNAKKYETSASNYASLAQAAYEEILGADIGKFGLQLANEHSVLQPIYDSSGQNICDSNGNEIQGRVVFADESEVMRLQQQINNLETFIKNVLGKMVYITEHSLLDSDYKGL